MVFSRISNLTKFILHIWQMFKFRFMLIFPIWKRNVFLLPVQPIVLQSPFSLRDFVLPLKMLAAVSFHPKSSTEVRWLLLLPLKCRLRFAVSRRSDDEMKIWKIKEGILWNVYGNWIYTKCATMTTTGHDKAKSSRIFLAQHDSFFQGNSSKRNIWNF